MNKWQRLFEIISPYLDREKMDALFKEDFEKWRDITGRFSAYYGISTPLKSDAPQKVIDAFEEYGQMYRKSVKNGSFGGPM